MDQEIFGRNAELPVGVVLAVPSSDRFAAIYRREAIYYANSSRPMSELSGRKLLALR